MAQMQERSREAEGDQEEDSFFRPKPYLEMSTKPWMNGTNGVLQESPSQSSEAFQTARATPSHDLQEGFPFEAPSRVPHDVTVRSSDTNPSSSEHVSAATEVHRNGGSTTSEPKNVSFANNVTTGHSASQDSTFGVVPNGRPTETNKSRRSDRFVSRMKALKLPGHSSNFPEADSAVRDPSQTPPMSPRRILHLRRQSEDDEVDQDNADTEDEGQAPIRGPAMKRRRLYGDGASTEPSTPQSSSFSRADRSDVRTSSEHRRFRPLRSFTADDAYDQVNGGVSEDEGRARLTRGDQWRRKSSAFVQGVRHPTLSSGRHGSAQEVSGRVRPRAFRSTTDGHDAAASSSNADASPSAWKIRSEPAARRWRKLTAGIKVIGKKQKAENAQDEIKSAELVTELVAIAPAAIMMTTHFIRDDKNQRRIPVLLEQLKFNITDSQLQEDTGPNRNIVFRIELEYGSGEMKMKWVIYRSLRDFWQLHSRFATQVSLAKLQRPGRPGNKAKMPRFPRTAFPFAAEFHGFNIEGEDEEEQPADEVAEPQEPQTPGDRPRHRRGPSMHFRRRSSAGLAGDLTGSGSDAPGVVEDFHAKRTTAANTLANKQRAKLEAYLKAMVRFVIFRPGMNRMCAFLELSSLGIKLAVEGGYHGKEGYLRLQSGKGVDFRRAWVPKTLYQRHKSMWFLVRSSYIVCVDNPASLNVYDVYLIDNQFTVTPKRQRVRDQKNAKDIAKTAGRAARHPQHHLLRLANSERKLKLLARTERQMEQFEQAINQAASLTPWSRPQRFGSFAPIRTKVYAQWLVDARDYMWNVSRALEMARDVIYIHDWWLSPELYMRRPGAISHKWRLDRILKRKAEEGVKVFVILYRNIESAIPIDSEYTKHALLDLSKNIFVQRSPNQYRSNVFFWAHHEKICIVDQTIAFCGGVDLCYGRWDSPDHRVVDDRPTGWEMNDKELNSDTCQMWAGKDYSNPRVRDFFELNQPFSEMYDRTKVPRMPWHDIGMQIVGQPARDLTRHFVQRWNYLLRIRKTTRPTPVLMPPTDFSDKQLEDLGLQGTCTIQMLRSAGEWSIGTPQKTEHSIMTAYCKLIQTSEHFVYIENQFFITSCVVEGTKVRNAIGDALVERIIRAHENGEPWSAVIVIPLMPGFEATVDTQEGTSIRLIMQCQFRSICRGETSIFGRLRAAGIEPTDYIRFYSLRAWGKLGPDKALVTEQLYIHAKCMVVDDRHAIIGSANINERSMLGDRDSEVAACVFDNDMIDSNMAGRPYKVGRFPHTLRMRLMREHLGIDVDHVLDPGDAGDLFDDEVEQEKQRPDSSRSARQATVHPDGIRDPNERPDATAISPGAHTFNYDAAEYEGTKYISSHKRFTKDSRVTGTETHRKDVEGFGVDHMHNFEDKPISQSRDTVTLAGGREVLLNDIAAGGKGSLATPQTSSAAETRKPSTIGEDSDGPEGTKAPLPPRPAAERLDTAAMGLPIRSQLPELPATDDTDIGGPPLQKSFTRKSGDSLEPLLSAMHRPVVTQDCMMDPLNRSFLDDTWHAVAEDNTKLFRQVFRCMPDRQVTNWAQYNAAVDYSERFAKSQGMDHSHMKMQQEATGQTGPPGHNLSTKPAKVLANPNRPRFLARKISEHILHKARGSRPDTADASEQLDSEERSSQPSPADLNEKYGMPSSTPNTPGSNADFDIRPINGKADGNKEILNEKEGFVNGDSNSTDTADAMRKRRRANTKSSLRPTDPVMGKGEAESLMHLVQGHLVEWPYEWLEQEERGGKWLFSLDQMSPLEIYN